MNHILRIDQEQLRYIYESAEKRMKFHPDIAKKYQDTIRQFSHFDSEKSAWKAFEEMEKDKRMPQIWAMVEKDEEFYKIKDYYIVTDDIMILIAAEYIGFAQLLY